MAVYKIFPNKDASIYSYYPEKNAGIDEILDLSVYKTIEDKGEVSRILISFDNLEIQDILNRIIKLADYKAYLKLFLANASSIPLDYTIYCYPVSGSWNMGTGRISNIPSTTNGVSWKWRYENSGSIFISSTNEATSSYTNNIGGGSWYNNLSSTQSFNHTSNQDIELDITNMINYNYYQNGFIIKHSDLLEFNKDQPFETKYFSADTHTIYPPCLEFRWNDFSYITGSLQQVDNTNIIITLNNNKGEFHEDSVNRFRVNVRDKYPVRVFKTTSLYTNNKILPPSSYYAIKDIKTDEFIIDFDPLYTKLSADISGNYFDLYMNGLEPERYYKVLIKSIINNNVIIVEDNNYFKIIR